MNYTDKRECGKLFLAACKATETNHVEADTYRSIIYTMTVILNGLPVIETWVEIESKLEEPEYYYSLTRKD